MDTKKLSYIAVIGAVAFLAYVVHDTRTQHEADMYKIDKGGIFSKITNSVTNANKNWTPNDSVTGNILAANFAQDQRDWALANMYLDRLNNEVANDPSTSLRMMLLAVSAGQFDRATEYAQRIEKIEAANKATAANTDDTNALGDGRDLAALVMMAQSVRAGDLATAETRLMTVQSDALKAFVQPVILSWLKAGQKKPLDGWADGLSLLQALHRGLAAEWAGQKNISDHIFDSLARVPLAPGGALMVAGYDIRNGRTEAARTALTEALRQNPNDASLTSTLDALDHGQKPLQRADLSYHMQGVTAGVAESFRDLSQMMLADKAFDSALVFAQIGRLIRNDVPGLSLLVGNIFYDQGRFDDAAAVFASTQPEDADYADAQVRLSELRSEQGDTAAAIRILEDLLDKKPSMRVAYALGEIYRGNDDNKKAVVAYDKAISLAIGDEAWSVYFVRAMALEELDEWDKAEADLKKALALRPENPHVLNYLGYSWADRNINLPQARAMLMQALSRAPTDPFITDSLGWVLFKQGDLKQAVLLLERAVSLKPYDPVLNDHLGDAYFKVGRTLEARYQWQRALDYADAKKDGKLIAEVSEKIKTGQLK